MADEQIDALEYVNRLTAEVASQMARAIQAEALAARFRAERDEAREALAQVLPEGRKPGQADDQE